MVVSTKTLTQPILALFSLMVKEMGSLCQASFSLSNRVFTVTKTLEKPVPRFGFVVAGDVLSDGWALIFNPAYIIRHGKGPEVTALGSFGI